MKKTILSITTAAMLLTATNVSANECPSTTDKIVFGTVGVLQGVVIGGPLGALWGLGSLLYVDNYENPSTCNQPKEEQKTVETTNAQATVTTEQKKEAVNTTSVDGKLNKITQNNANKLDSEGFTAMPSVVNFAFDSYKIEKVPQKLKELNNDAIEAIKIEGHTDPKGTDEYNYALGLKRANAVKTVLESEGIESKKLATISYGESSPISTDDAENRRVDLSIKYKK